MRYYDLKNPTFEQWLKRGVYVAQCRTYARSNELCGGSSGSIQIRTAKPYRDAYCQCLRDMVALSIRMERFSKRHVKVPA